MMRERYQVWVFFMVFAAGCITPPGWAWAGGAVPEPLAATPVTVIPQANPETPVAPPAPPDQATLGVYLLSLHDLDPAKSSFGADFWIWSDHVNANIKPLKTMEYINARQTSVSLYDSEPKGQIVWAQQKVQGTFRTHWDMKNFPFDRHRLSIFIEEGLVDTSHLVYAADTKESNFSRDIAIDGYTLKGLSVTAGVKDYESNFGDPTAEPTSQYSRLRVDFDIERSSLLLFFKLHFAMYAAFLVSAIGFLMLPNIPSMMNTVNSLVVGALFATIINLRAVDAVLGRSEALTLVDRLHALSFFHFVVLGLISVWILVTRPRWKDTALRRFSWLAGAAYLLSYAAGNAVLIWQAANA